MPVDTKRKLDIEERRDKTMYLASCGASQRQIAKELGVSRSLVNKDIARRVRDHARDHEDTAKVRAMLITQFEFLLLKWSERAQSDPVALDRVMKLHEKIAQYSGVAPTVKVEHVVPADSEPQRIVVEFVKSRRRSEDAESGHVSAGE